MAHRIDTYLSKKLLLKWLGLIIFWSLPAFPSLFISWVSTDSGWAWHEIHRGGKQQLNMYRLLFWYVWIPLTPWIARLGRRLPPLLDGTWQLRNVALHVLFSGFAGVIWKVYDLCLSAILLKPESLLFLFRSITLKAWVFDWWPAAIYWLVLITTLAWGFYWQAHERELQLTEARMGALKAQVRPDFLFRTLHSITTLMENDVAAARKTIARLSDILRASLAQPPGDEVTLEDELNLARHYVEIEDIRRGEGLESQFDIAPECLGLMVPHLLLQPLMESALRSDGDGGSQIASVLVAGKIQGSSLCIEIECVEMENDGAVETSLQPGDQEIMANAEARLKQFYGDGASLQVAFCAEAGRRCSVRLPLQR